MEGTFEDDMLPIYNAVKQFDFKKSFSVTIDYTVNDSNANCNIIEDTNNEHSRITDTPTTSVYFQKEMSTNVINKNKEIFISNNSHNVFHSDKQNAAEINQAIIGSPTTTRILDSNHQPLYSGSEISCTNRTLLCRKEQNYAAESSFVNRQTISSLPFESSHSNKNLADSLSRKDPNYVSKLNSINIQPISAVSKELSGRNRNASDILFSEETNNASKSHTVDNQAISSIESNRNMQNCSSISDNIYDRLNILSMNLINTLQAYSYVSTIVNSTNVSQARKYYARNRYRDTKIKLFRSSFEIVEQDILPQKNNVHFMRRFTTNTKNMAYNLNFFCDMKDIEIIFDELMTWVSSWIYQRTEQNQKQYQQRQTSGNMNDTEPSALKQLLQYDWNVSNYMNPTDSSTSEEVIKGPKTCLLAYGSPGNEFSVNISTEILDNINVQNGLNKLNMQANENVPINDQFNTAHERSFNQTINISKNSNPPVTYNNLQHDVLPIRQSPKRSISRDSGFMSPGTEQDNDLWAEEALQSQQAPYITHVTSLNPRANYIPPGHCVVCAAITSTKCIGCFNVYYCSSTCQSSHWKSHEYYCKNSAKKRRLI